TCSYATTDSAYSSMTAFDGPNTGTSHTAVLSGLTSSTGHDYFVRCADTTAQENTMTTSAHGSFTTPDTTPPVAPVITTSNANIDADTYTIAGTAANEGGTRIVRLYDDDNNILVGSDSVPQDDTAWSILVPLVQNTENSFIAITFDEAGNDSIESLPVNITEATVVGDNIVPPTPVIAGSNQTLDADSYELSGSVGADTPVDNARTVTIYRNGTVVVGSVIIPLGSISWSITVPLLPESSNTFTAVATDQAGNTSPVSNNRVITESPTLDTSKPVITLLGQNPLTLTVGDSYIEYGATANDNVDGNITGIINIDDDELNMSAAGTYQVIYDVTDSAGNVALTEKRTVIVNPAFDDTALLVVTGIDAVKTYATADNSYANGWSWVYHITVPTNETSFQMKFSDFISGLNSIVATNNIRFYSSQSSAHADQGHAIDITASNSYSAVAILDTDLDSATAGRQIEVTVEMKVPLSSAGGSYSGSYGIFSEI
ncbi:immunoglobulin-like domain-containing protein, partial [Shewanella vesiculosa]|uniref:immunoglobulin-like domain-containing protein n=1 Tax=Shewanella vesiculosa TaxID=518738 RepID=UPI0023587C44